MNPHTVRLAARLGLPVLMLAGFAAAPLFVVAVATAPAAAQEKKAAAAAGPAANTGGAAKAPAANDKLILPFIGNDTFVVGRLDVARVDVDAIEQYANKMVNDMVKAMGGQLPPEAVKQMRAQMAEPMRKLREGLAAFTEAGGHHVYILMDAEAAAQNSEPVLVTPLGEGADAAKLGEILSQMDDTGEATTAEIGKALIFGNRPQVDALKERMTAAGGKPAEAAARPDLAKAFAAGGDAPFRMALVPGEAGRKFMEEKHPTLPEQVGGGDIKLISRGVRWATAGITQKPSFGMNLTVQASDAESAKGLMDLFAKSMASLKEQQGPQAGLGKQLDAMKPVLKGDTITLNIDVATLQAGMLGGMRAEGEIGPDDGAPAQPDQPDDGGL